MEGRGILGALPALVLCVCAAACHRAPEGSPAPVSASLSSETKVAAVVTTRKGKVELSHGGGQWSDARVGDELVPSDALRTEAGEAEIAIGGVRMRLHESSAVHVKQTTRTSMRAQVHGSVESEVDPGKGAVVVEMEGTDAVATSTGGHFFVTADGRGVVAVAAVTGSVNLVAHAKQVQLKEGQVSHVDSGAPDAPSPALRRVLLSIRWPQELATRKDTVPVSGKVEPGSRVFIQDRRVAVEKDGSFTAQVPLHAGAQKVAVLVVDPLGRRKQAWATIVREAPPAPETLAKLRKKKEWQWR